MDVTLVLKIDFFSMPRFYKQRGNSSLVGEKMLLEVPEGNFFYKGLKRTHFGAMLKRSKFPVPHQAHRHSALPTVSVA